MVSGHGAVAAALCAALLCFSGTVAADGALRSRSGSSTAVPGKPSVAQKSTDPCCQTCTEPLAKYYSVDHGVGHTAFCGETCLDPKKFNEYHLFEKNLTKSTSGEHPCATQYTPDGGFYNVYNKTVTHGVPGILSVTLDLYGEH